MGLRVQVPSDMVRGDVEHGYGPVADAFRRNFEQGREIGAACVVYRDGRKVVDLWGGYRDGVTRDPWEHDTMVPVFSTSKGVSSMAVAVLHARGLLDYDERVATYWPEFAAAGKAEVTVRQLLSHQAGLPVIDRPLNLTDLSGSATLAAALAEQRPAWTPGERHGYHGQTLGWYESELVSRIDPQGRHLGRFFAEEVAAPLDLEFHIGLPEHADRRRIARIHGFRTWEMMLHITAMPPAFALAFSNPWSLTARAFQNPRVLGVPENINRPDVQAAEIPAVNGIGQVGSIARLYGDAAAGGAGLGLTASTLDALKSPAEAPSRGLADQVLRLPSQYSLGYVKPFPAFRFGSSSGTAFGTMGLGGSFGFADPDTGIGFAYAMNRLGFHLWDDPREVALREALFVDVLGEMPQRPDATRARPRR
ncbi:serine hydrolase domain-containing protein [Actinoplanes derwentensis]|uniref:CubicO group peptidase, beta-lactamase class C family n=1 Tax=Actinoplanes derwentensis TaxID=113562 RepID=A0A1H2CVY8_9ACTN|nr:serine hydrolase domain-containing protein [Actinoplanes derwentensis]GID88352.1 serine hydrolase [Actinoplanes derwentensis]SDT74678.1 CubicO group peptidase, beta-lactamase class C family [Actinoplanes derwentensis]